jgi:hypothetical protein
MKKSSLLIQQIEEVFLDEKGLLSFQKTRFDLGRSQGNKPDVDDYYCMRCGACCIGCRGLSGILGKDVKCDFYDIRPQMCRDFEAEGDECVKCRNYAFGFGPYW